MISNGTAKKKKAGDPAGLRKPRPLLGFDGGFDAFGAKHNGRLSLALPDRNPLQIGAVGALRCPLREGAIVTERKRFSTPFTLCHFLFPS
jgi:hypothetical protein